MQAMVLRQPRSIEEKPLALEEAPEPEPRENEVLLRVRACGVCHTDLHTVEGELRLPKLPLMPGHQIVGIVERLGKEASRFRPGERVGVPWLNWACGECDFCRKGLENLCPHARFTGLHVDGGYAQYAVVHEEFAYPLPDGFPDERAAPLLCAGVIGYRALRLSGVSPGERLGLYGFGASAHVTIQVARYLGCKVFVFTRSVEHQKLARELGAAWVGEPRAQPPELLDSAIIFAPAGWLVPESLRALRPGGTVALAGIYMSPIPEMSYELIYGERTVRSVANMTRADARELLELAGKIPIETAVETYRLAEANEVLLRLKEGRVRAAAVLIP
ncbi:MAG: zinc-dependent alcohol dehydrogenase family protein [Candidatus Acetothermia bacterium]|jgi:propanol-preferring alcohol dehydrogenase|nr:zinc-dependent alcohol dehydrogenase family protein [Candidatus Acetothermia bacterium]MDH7505075.1 zinc-dependent alcohol dehydrogenase family protein [Candidatus Acetothermia bacterium]